MQTESYNTYATPNPFMYILDPQKLVNKINASLADREVDLSLGEFENRTPRKNPFIYRIGNREIGTRGKFPLIIPKHGLLRNIIGIDVDCKVGYVFVETGDVDISDREDGARYEAIKFRLKSPLQLKDRRIIPNCSVKLYTEQYEFSELYKQRSDHIRRLMTRRRTDLSNILPTEWFLRTI